MKVFDYSTSKYNFHEIIRGFLDTDDLSNLKAELTAEDDPEEKNSLYKNMEQADHYDKLRKKLDSEQGRSFYSLYEQFIAEEVRPLFGEPVIYQKKPTHRIHFRDSSGSARFHTDMDYGHHRCEINYTVPQTKMYDTNSIWIETKEGKKDYRPMEAEVGQFVQFDGSYLEHGARHNQTGDTRVSFDFRIMRLSEAPDPYKSRSHWEQAETNHPLFKNFKDFGLCE